jgi:hypothetical protein
MSSKPTACAEAGPAPTADVSPVRVPRLEGEAWARGNQTFWVQLRGCDP